jgi:hypothetical protein
MKTLASVLILLTIGIFQTVTKIVIALNTGDNQNNIVYSVQQKTMPRPGDHAVHLFRKPGGDDTLVKFAYIITQTNF